MTITYALHENHLTSDPNDYTAVVTAVGTLSTDDLIERMLNHGSTLTKADALAALELYHNVIGQALVEGYSIVTPTVNYRASIKGVFNGPSDGFDASRHTVAPNTSPSRGLRNQLKTASVQKGETDTRVPNLVEYIDFGSNTRNSLLTPGNAGQISGHRLKHDPTDSAQGVYFVAEDGTATPATTIMTNEPAKLMFLIPTLPAGLYSLQVRAAFGQTVRVGSLQADLTVT